MERDSCKSELGRRNQTIPIDQRSRLKFHSESTAHPRIEDHFVRTNFCDAIIKRHPYDFAETYFILREYFEYDSYYVNFGYWKDGLDTNEPGRQLAQFLASNLALAGGDRVIDVGSGLGQAAVDLCKHHDLGYVIGLNTNSRQVAFANALARSEGLSDKISHFAGDASDSLLQFSGQGFKALLAMECAGHFRDPVSFLGAAHSVLGAGGRIALSLNVAASELSLMQRSLLYTAFGFIPKTLETWLSRLKQAGFCDVRADDITEKVLVHGLNFALQRAKQRSPKIHPIIRRYTILQLKTALRSVDRGTLRYYAVFASVNGPE